MAVVPRLRKRTLGLSAAEQEDLLETLHRSKEHLLDDLDTLKKRKTERVEQVLQCKVCKKTLPLKVVGLTRMPTQWAYLCTDCDRELFPRYEPEAWLSYPMDPEE